MEIFLRVVEALFELFRSIGRGFMDLPIAIFRLDSDSELLEPSFSPALEAIFGMAISCIAFLLLLMFVGTIYDGFFGHGDTMAKMATRFSTGTAVVGYKVANLKAHGFEGISGGGAYGFVSEGKLDPGFHCFRDLTKLQHSYYSRSGSVILEVLLYGAVMEYEDGYIGSKQRVLQIIPNRDGGGNCYHCGRSSSSLYVDREKVEYGTPFVCSLCMKLMKFKGFFWLRDSRSRFVPIRDYFEEANSKSGNKFPVGYSPSIAELNPTVIPSALPAESSAR